MSGAFTRTLDMLGLSGRPEVAGRLASSKEDDLLQRQVPPFACCAAIAYVQCGGEPHGTWHHTALQADAMHVLSHVPVHCCTGTQSPLCPPLMLGCVCSACSWRVLLLGQSSSISTIKP